MTPETMINPLIPDTLESLPLEDRSSFPELSCVYYALSASGEILYIGKAKSLKARWQGHHRLEQLKRFKSVRIAWVGVHEDELDSFERLCINHHSPPLNNSRSGDDPIATEPTKPPTFGEVVTIASLYPSDELHGGLCKARYVNECPECKLLGLFGNYDLYECSSHGERIIVSLHPKYGRTASFRFEMTVKDDHRFFFGIKRA
jgi:hypothetical protein